MFKIKDKEFFRNKWFFSLGGVGRDLAYSLYTYFLLTFILYTKNVTDGQFAAISIIMIICRIWDGINDPIMGGIIENTRTKFGKFKPWIFIGAVTNAVVLVLIYSLPLSGTAFVIAFTFLYLIWDITYTMNDIGYWSMMPALTSDPEQRNSITSVANLFAGLGTILANGLIPVFTVGSLAIGGSAITAYKVISVVIALAFVGCQTMTCVGVKEKNIANAPLEEKVGFKKMVSILLNNKQVLWTAVILLFSSLSGTLLTAFGTNYIYLTYGYEGSFATYFTICFGASSAMVYVVYPALAKRINRLKLCTVSLGLSAVGYIVFAVCGTLITAKTPSFIVLCGAGFIIGFGYNIFYLVAAVCLANTIEYNEYITGNRDESIIFSIRPFMSKLSSSLQQLIIMIVYLAIGLTAITNQISDAENKATSHAITEVEKLDIINTAIGGADSSMTLILRLVMAILPLVFMGIAYYVIRNKYIITEDKYNEILAELDKRKESK